MAYKRTKETLNKMRKDPVVFKSSLDKFAKHVDKDYPRFVPVPRHMQHNKDGLAYWIPLFSVWQKGKARIVFDSRASTDGICLNDALYQGPDRNNSLRGVLLRFRKLPWAVIADIENMFHQIAIPEEQSTYLRFFWYKNNDPDREIIEWMSRVHLMGNISSPAVANLAVRYAARKDPPANGDQ